MNITNATLEEAYAARHAEVIGLISRLRKQVLDYPAPDRIGNDWGHVGNLGRVAELLREALGEED